MVRFECLAGSTGYEVWCSQLVGILAVDVSIGDGGEDDDGAVDFGGLVMSITV